MLSNAKETLVSAYSQIVEVGSSRARLVEWKKTDSILKPTCEHFELDLEFSTKSTEIRVESNTLVIWTDCAAMTAYIISRSGSDFHGKSFPKKEDPFADMIYFFYLNPNCRPTKKFFLENHQMRPQISAAISICFNKISHFFLIKSVISSRLNLTHKKLDKNYKYWKITTNGLQL